MSCITKAARQQMLTIAFDEACDAYPFGPDVSKMILERALPKHEAAVVFEAVALVNGGDASRLEN